MATTLDTVLGTHAQLAAELAEVAARVRRTTVQVHVGRRGGGAGSGVIWRESGLVVTNAHVARGARAAVELCDGRRFDAEVTARDVRRDLAALTLDAAGLPAAEIGDSAVLRVGELVIAVGCPWGMAGALSAGVVHAVGSRDTGGDTWVRADVRLAPGNSGGPLADARGRVVGINSMIANGLALAVPSGVVERFLQAPEERVTLGVTVRPVGVVLGRGPVLGLLILEIAAGSAADEAGLLIGDTVIGAAGRRFSSPDDFLAVLQQVGPGATLELELVRGGARIRRGVVPRAETRGAKAA